MSPPEGSVRGRNANFLEWAAACGSLAALSNLGFVLSTHGTAQLIPLAAVAALVGLAWVLVWTLVANARGVGVLSAGLVAVGAWIASGAAFVAFVGVPAVRRLTEMTERQGDAATRSEAMRNLPRNFAVLGSVLLVGSVFVASVVSMLTVFLIYYAKERSARPSSGQ